MSRSKTLISGCGLSWSGQSRKTWVSMLRVAGVDIEDLGGPAVSNNWIIDRVALSLLERKDVGRVILQLTALGKLDVSINEERYDELVRNDSQRNFVYQGVWPSSSSQEHVSKQLWYHWLYSPDLEVRDLEVKLRLLDSYCSNNQVELVVLQGYHIPWRQYGAGSVLDVLDDAEQNLYQQYLHSDRYQYHDHSQGNAVPELGWQFETARQMCQRFWPQHVDQLQRLRDALCV
jgi:hypothetical protein